MDSDLPVGKPFGRDHTPKIHSSKWKWIVALLLVALTGVALVIAALALGGSGAVKNNQKQSKSHSGALSEPSSVAPTTTTLVWPTYSLDQTVDVGFYGIDVTSVLCGIAEVLGVNHNETLQDNPTSGNQFCAVIMSATNLSQTNQAFATFPISLEATHTGPLEYPTISSVDDDASTNSEYLWSNVSPPGSTSSQTYFFAIPANYSPSVIVLGDGVDSTANVNVTSVGQGPQVYLSDSYNEIYNQY